MRDHPAVREATREHVRSLAEGIGYRASVSARALRTGRHDTLCLVVPNLDRGSESLAIAAAAEAARLGLGLILAPLPADEPFCGSAYGEHLEKFFGRSSGLPVDGFIVVTASGDAWAPTADKPVVVVGSTRHEFARHAVVRNNEADARLATQHLIDQGRRNIVALLTGRPTPLEGARVAGYRQSMAEHDLVARVCISPEEGGASAYSKSVEAMAKAAEPFDALIGVGESTTFPALRSLHRLRLRVPEDVAIVGFEPSLAALATDPPLTTIEEPSRELAWRAIDGVLRLIKGETPPSDCDRIVGRLVERSST